MRDDEIPNQHTTAVRLAPMTPDEELRHLRAQVTELQSRGTKQLIDARAAAFEMAAERCEWFALTLRSDLGIAAARDCAQEIRSLAKNVP